MRTWKFWLDLGRCLFAVCPVRCRQQARDGRVHLGDFHGRQKHHCHAQHLRRLPASSSSHSRFSAPSRAIHQNHFERRWAGKSFSNSALNLRIIFLGKTTLIVFWNVIDVLENRLSLHHRTNSDRSTPWPLYWATWRRHPWYQLEPLLWTRWPSREQCWRTWCAHASDWTRRTTWCWNTNEDCNIRHQKSDCFDRLFFPFNFLPCEFCLQDWYLTGRLLVHI